MKKQNRKRLSVAVLFAELLVVGPASAQELAITSFKNGYVSWNNVDSNLYYTVEYRPNLSETNLAWDGSHRVSQDVKSTNAVISVPIGMFYRVVGSASPLHYSAVVPKTGQTNLYQTGDDGTYQKGVAWPNPRFTVQADTNCVLDNLTGLIWARNANLGGSMIWSNAIVYCENLNYGGQTDWRLPNLRELLSLADDGQYNPPLPMGHPFAGVKPNAYWSGTSYANITNSAWYVSMLDGSVRALDKFSGNYVWPVRGGQ